MDPEARKSLVAILSDHGMFGTRLRVCICLTSTRIASPTPANHFAFHDLRVFPSGVVVIGDTPQLSGQGRGAEVAEWLIFQHPPVERFVILDDSDLHARSFVECQLGPNFVHTVTMDEDHPEREGLTTAKADAAIRILKGQLVEKDNGTGQSKGQSKGNGGGELSTGEVELQAQNAAEGDKADTAQGGSGGSGGSEGKVLHQTVSR